MGWAGSTRRCLEWEPQKLVRLQVKEIQTQRVAANYGRLTAVHHRFHASNNTPTEAPTSFNEIFTNAFLLKAPLLVCHNNDYGWWEIEEKLKLARERGLNMWSEYYPYAAGASTIGSAQLQPEFWEGKLGYKHKDTLYDPVQDKFLDRAGYEEVGGRDTEVTFHRTELSPEVPVRLHSPWSWSWWAAQGVQGATT